MLQLDKQEREKLWRQVIEAIERYQAVVDGYRVSPGAAAGEIRQALARIDFEQPMEPSRAVDFAVSGLTEQQVHTSHPAYFGLFNPAPTTMGIAADMLVAAFNPQLAASTHSPFAVEVEQYLVQSFGQKFGYAKERADGCFASGGQEANATALLAALNYHFPQLRLKGLQSLPGQPVFYVSSEAHHSLVKAAICAGLGLNAVRQIAVEADLKMDIGSLERQIAEDKERGFHPFMIVATAGSTNSGIIDPIAAAARLAQRHHLWLHVDAAWGGACALVPELRYLLSGCEQADSITFDCHKWLSVPMAAGMFLTKHPDVLERTFRVANEYMPKDDSETLPVDPFAHSMQWSRRFIGLKVFLSLAVAGWSGYRETIRKQLKLGDELRSALTGNGWQVINQTALPVVCFVDGRSACGRQSEYLDRVCAEVVASGRAWISTTRVGAAQPVLRACITNFRTASRQITELVSVLERARAVAAGVAAR